jgi:hypothetical protein
VDAAVKLTQRDCYLDPELFLQLLTPAVYVLGTTHAQDLTIALPPPVTKKNKIINRRETRETGKKPMQKGRRHPYRCRVTTQARSP